MTEQSHGAAPENEPTAPEEASEPSPSPEPSPEPKEITIKGRTFKEDDLARLIEDRTNEQNWRAENTRRSEELAARERRVREIEASIEERLSDMKEPAEDEDPDELVSRGALREELRAVREEIRGIDQQREQVRQQEAQARYVSTIDSTVNDCISSSKVLNTELVSAEAREIALARLWKDPGPPGDDPRAIEKHVRKIMAGVEKHYMTLRDAHVRGYVKGKEGVRSSTPTMPSGGAPGQPTQHGGEKIDSMRKLDAHFSKLTRHHDGR